MLSLLSTTTRTNVTIFSIINYPTLTMGDFETAEDLQSAHPLKLSPLKLSESHIKQQADRYHYSKLEAGG